MGFLRRNKAWADVEKVYATRRMRAGKGKLRNRRHVQKLGPLVIYDQDQSLTKAFRNIPGVDTIQVDALNLLKLDSIYGTWRKASESKKSWNLPMPLMANTDLSKLLKAEEIRKVLRAPNRKIVKAKKTKANPLKNIKAMLKLNPYAAVTARNSELLSDMNLAAKAALHAKKNGKPAPVNKVAKRAAAMKKKPKKSKK